MSVLERIRDVSNALADEIAPLTPEAWQGPTNCPPWRVRELAAHVVISGQGFVDNVRRGLAGSSEPSAQRRHEDLEAATPDVLAHELRATTDEFVGLYDGLSESQLDAICFHRRGNRSVRWYAVHRLAELAFHTWDLQTSLGRPAVLDEQVATELLPTLLESNLPRTYAAGLSAERGRGERYVLTVVDDPMATWLVRIDADQLQVTGGSGDADLTISGAAGALALLIYGRAELGGLLESGSVTAVGDATLVERFALIFPRP